MSLSQVCGFMATARSTPPRRPRQPASTMRTSYHVGNPWMFDGKILRAATGTPMRRIARANRPFADAEPEPLTLANLTTKSLTRASVFIGAPTALVRGDSRDFHRRRDCMLGAAAVIGARRLEQEFLHVPRARRTALGAQAAMQADIFVLHHHASGLHR